MKYKKITIRNIETINVDEKYGTYAGPLFWFIGALCILSVMFIIALIAISCGAELPQ